MENRIFTLTDLMNRYGMSRQAIHKYIKDHISELNTDTAKAEKNGKEWQFNQKAVDILDKLRNYTANVEFAEEIRKKDSYIGLLEEISILKTQLARVQQEYLLLQDRHIKDKDMLYKQLLESRETEHKTAMMVLESKSQQEIATTKERAMDERINKLVEELEAAREREKFMKQEVEAREQARKEAEAKLAAEKSKSLWQRIFG